jgi:hypothetical protein
MGAEVPLGTLNLHLWIRHNGNPPLGAAVVHIPTNTTIYINVAGTEETRTIMRAELVAIHAALTTFASHE